MTFQGDPYRTLGLVPGASVNEIRSAYRRLAKRYHPDAAGERALPRFLAIQAAYEALVDANGNLRRVPRASGPGSSPGGRGTAARGEPWRADPDRARASRDAWRARGRAGSQAGPGSTAAPPGRGGGPDGAGGDGSSGSEGRERRSPGGQAEHHFRRHRRTATPGSTTYDEAAETPLDPAWDGGTWYGASSGTYWTLNPREYADPRKHGPEYRRRAWRAAGQRSSTAAPQRPTQADTASTVGDEPDRPAGPVPAPETAPRPGAEGSDAGVPAEDAPSVRVASALATLLPERLLALARRGVPGSAVIAGIATVPVPWAAGIVLAGLAGCSAGGCPPLVAALALVAWAVAALVVAVVPTVAALGAFAVLVAAAGSLLSGVVVAVVRGDLAGAVLQAAGTLGVVLYCFALVVGGARLYGRRETGAPRP